jgi:TetR/AcrR family transcriptional repressor of mexJK operon
MSEADLLPPENLTPEKLTPEKRAVILAGAALVFAEDGYEGASMARIAQQAGVSKGTLYNYFAGKAGLFAAHVDQQCTANLARVFGRIEPDGDPAATLHEIGQRMLGLMLSPAGLAIYRVVISEAGKFPALAQTFYDAGPARAIASTAAWLAEQTARGHLRVDDPAFAAEQFLSLCQTRLGLSCRLLLQGQPDPALIERVVAAAVEMFLARYAVRP